MGISWKIACGKDIDHDDEGAWERLASEACPRFALLEGDELHIYRRDAGIRQLRWAPPRMPERLARLSFPDLTHDVVDRLFDGYDVVLPTLDDGRVRILPALGFRHAKSAGDARWFLGLTERQEETASAELMEAARVLEAAATLCVRYGTILRFYY
jgi:hypothetical protein